MRFKSWMARFKSWSDLNRKLSESDLNRKKHKYLNHDSRFKSHFLILLPALAPSWRAGAPCCTMWRDFHTSRCQWGTQWCLVRIWASAVSCERSFPLARPCAAHHARCYPTPKVPPASHLRPGYRLWHVSQRREEEIQQLECDPVAWGSERTRSPSCAAGPRRHTWPETRASGHPVAYFWSLLPLLRFPMRRPLARPAVRTIRPHRSWVQKDLNQTFVLRVVQIWFRTYLRFKSSIMSRYLNQKSYDVKHKFFRFKSWMTIINFRFKTAQLRFKTARFKS